MVKEVKILAGKVLNMNRADIDWEYPSNPKRGGRKEDKDNLVSLMKEMRAAFGTKYGKGFLRENLVDNSHNLRTLYRSCTRLWVSSG